MNPFTVSSGEFSTLKIPRPLGRLGFLFLQGKLLIVKNSLNFHALKLHPFGRIGFLFFSLRIRFIMQYCLESLNEFIANGRCKNHCPIINLTTF